MDVIDAPAGYAGPSFADLSQAAAAAGVTIPDNPAPAASLMSLDYWQQKAADFQSTLNALDSGWNAANIALNSPDLLSADPTLADDLRVWLADFDSKKSALRLTAEAINGGAQMVNSLGGTFQKLNIPGTLGFAPVALPLAAVGAFAVAATLIAWGVAALRGLNERLGRAQLLGALPPDGAAALAQSMAASDSALAQAEGTSFSTIATYVKWGGIALALFVAYRALGGSKMLAGFTGASDD
jgi:hypothetical protein